MPGAGPLLLGAAACAHRNLFRSRHTSNRAAPFFRHLMDKPARGLAAGCCLHASFSRARLLDIAIMLGRWAWTLRPRLHVALLITHGVLLVPGTAFLVGGVYAMRAAARSTASGGGILSPVAAFPLVIGIPIVVLALCSIATALTVVPSMRGVKTKL